MTELLTRKEARGLIKRSHTYLWKCERAGLKFIAGRIDAETLLQWLKANPQPTKRQKTPSVDDS